MNVFRDRPLFFEYDKLCCCCCADASLKCFTSNYSLFYYLFLLIIVGGLGTHIKTDTLIMNYYVMFLAKHLGI